MTPVPDNPWQQRTIVVALANDANQSRDFRPLAAQALEYWEANDDRHGAYQVNTSFRPNATDADLVIRIVDDVGRCGIELRADPLTVGCARLISAGDTAAETETVSIQAGYSDRATVDIMRHELGHIYGVRHGEEPSDVMNHTNLYAQLPTPDVDDRVFPWRSTQFTVYVDLSDARDHERRAINQRINQTLAFYEAGAQGWVPDNVSLEFERVPTRDQADIVIEVGYDTLQNEVSDGAVFGRDIDTDRSLEYYTYANMTIDTQEMPTSNVGWHVGVWLAYSFSTGSYEEFPDSLTAAETEGERADWPPN